MNMMMAIPTRAMAPVARNKSGQTESAGQQRPDDHGHGKRQTDGHADHGHRLGAVLFAGQVGEQAP